MSDLEGLPLFQNLPAKPAYKSVTELTSLIRTTLEPQFSQVWVQGEISNFRPAASGHVYFSLKDENAVISAAIFSWGRRTQKFEIKDGLKVQCRGKISVYPPRGSYQLVVDQIEPLGVGALQVAFEKLKAKLQAEGLFDPTRKREIPKFPKRIAVITSPTGAAIQDMINILRRRAPFLRVSILPALVQGDQAPAEIIRAIEFANQHKCGDVLVLARGGGSIEDLWAFNDEKLARTIALSQIPTLSAVGHEIDFTISDFVADLRAPTPSAAAEIVSAGWLDFGQKLDDLGFRLERAMKRTLLNAKQLIQQMSLRIKNPRSLLKEQAQRLHQMNARITQGMRMVLERVQSKVLHIQSRLEVLSPLKVLDRGYTLIKDPANDGKLIRSVKSLTAGQKLEILFADGQGSAQWEKTHITSEEPNS